jgi:peptidoglycan/xylan/chitin deacetylase (PgdA/CDA1 family)
MSKSKLFLENIIQKPVSTLVYPNGSYSQDLIDYGRSIGYHYHLITGYKHDRDRSNSDIFDRLTINPYISSYNQMLAIVTNKYDGKLPH